MVLLILNDGPYGTERSYNGLRLALALAKTEGTEVRVFLMADAVGCAKPGQATPDGYYNISRALKGLTTRGVPVGACGPCMDARGYTDGSLRGGRRPLLDAASRRVDGLCGPGHHVSAGRVSYIRTATTSPESAVSAATVQMAAGIPARSAIKPVSSPPTAKPRSRQSR